MSSVQESAIVQICSDVRWYQEKVGNPQHPHPLKHPQNIPQMTITNFNYEGSYLPGLIYKIVVKADLGTSTP